MLFTRKQIQELDQPIEARSKVTQVFVHPEIEGEIVVTWVSGNRGIAIHANYEKRPVTEDKLFATTLNDLLEAGWISSNGGGLSSNETKKILEHKRKASQF